MLAARKRLVCLEQGKLPYPWAASAILLQVSQIWKGKAAGEEANDTPVHEASTKAGKVE